MKNKAGNKSSLKKDQKEVKMFRCEKCGQEFTRKDNLKRHLESGVCSKTRNKSRKKQNVLEQYIDKDKIGGKIIRLNRVRLDSNEKRYSELLFFGDIHYGHPGCDIERAQRNIDYCLKKHIYVLGMGDYIEAGLRNSIGDSMYMQTLNPQKQMDYMTDLFKPLAEKGLLLGLLMGNHEGRILKETSVNIVKMMSKLLKVPYLGYACWNLIYVGNQSYTVYSLHGSSGSRYVYTKLKALVDIAHNFDADILAMGHVHELADEAILVQQVNKARKMVIERKKFLILTGSYLRYDDSYAQEKGYPMGKLGSPKVKLFTDKKDIHISE
jgi:predicted phosphodiesterase/ribosomal protein S26